MLFAPARFASRRDTIAFVVCIVLSIGARVAPENFQHDLASAMRSTVLAPLLAIQSRTLSIPTALRTAEEIGRQRDSVTAEALELIQLREENRRLRAQLGLSARQPWGPVPAEVLSQGDAPGRTLVVSAGSNQGVKEGNSVVARQTEGHGAGIQDDRPPGLLGVVRSTAPNTSIVTLWTDQDFGAGAMTADGKALGIVGPLGSVGPNSYLMELRGVPFLEVVETGTEVVTSGLGLSRGGVYPHGILIGVVDTIGEEREGWSRTYILRPAVQPIAVSHVIILTAPGDTAAEGFEADST